MLKPGEIIGNYQIESAIGKGGMGMVFLAYDLRLERQVALKVINSSKYEDQANNHIKQRFAIEAKALAKLNDPHIVQIFDFDPDAQPPYLVMEYVTGRNLNQLINRDERIPIAQVLDAAAQILTGLNVAHKVGVIHRDIKPSNILLASNGIYKLVDFGLARGQQSNSQQEALTEADTVLGTLQYLAPEVAQGKEASEQGDLYALGVTLYHMATGHTPHESHNKLELLKLIATEPAPPISQHIAHLPLPLLGWFSKLLAYKISERFQNCSEALAQLHNIADSINASGLKRAISITPAPTAFTSDAKSQDTVLLSTQANPSSFMSSIQISSHRPETSSNTALQTVERQRQKLSISFSLKIVISLWLISSCGSFFAIKYIADQTFEEQLNQLKNYLKLSANAAALLIDGDAHQQIKTRADGESPAFIKIHADLTKFRLLNSDILNIYTMAPTAKTAEYGFVQFICDASPLEDSNHNNFIDESESIAEIGAEYNAKEKAPLLLNGFEEACTDDEITVDKWGSVLSGYAPIRNSAGESVGLVGIDVSSDTILAMRAISDQRALWVQFISFIIFLIAAIIVANRFKRPIQLLQHSLSAAANGDYNQDVQLNDSSEFTPLAKSINIMLKELREKDTLRKAYEMFVAREMHGNITGSTSSSSIASIIHQAKRQINVLCSFEHKAQSAEAHLYEKVLSRTISVFFDHGGLIDHALGNGILVSFSQTEHQHNTEESAIRAALKAQQVFGQNSPHGKLTISIHNGDDENHTLLSAINKIASQIHSDILISDTVFTPVQMMFYADRLADVDLPQHPKSCLYAIKGSVSAPNNTDDSTASSY